MDVQIDSIAIGELHQKGEMATIGVGEIGCLHDHDLAKPLHPFKVVNVGGDVGDKIYDIIILKRILFGVGIRSGTVHNDRSNAFIISGGVQYDIHHLFIGSHHVSRFLI
jgi:hypothetical protein